MVILAANNCKALLSVLSQELDRDITLLELAFLGVNRVLKYVPN